MLEALAAITKFGKQVGRAVGKVESEAVRQLKQRLAVTLVRDNTSMIIAVRVKKLSLCRLDLS